MQTQGLDSLFLKPRSVVFVGVPRKSGPGALNPVDNLRRWGYEGKVHLVHPHVREIAGLPVLKGVSGLNDSADLAVISTPRETVPLIVDQCGAKGIRALIVTNQGFAEADGRGRELQDAMVEAARRHNARILGPNTLGVSNAFERFNSSFMPLEREEVPIGLICQSGVFFVGSKQLVGGMGIAVDVGNACDVSAVDCLEWVAKDSRLKAIAVHMEGIPDGRRFVEVARRISSRVPIVVLKTGRSPEGARAAASHSGALAGEDKVVDVAMQNAGVIRVDETQDMVDLVRAFSRLPPMRGNKVAIVTLTGAGGIILLDQMRRWGLEPARLAESTLKQVQQLAPEWMPLSNPIDIWPALMKHGMRKVYRMTLRDVLRDPEVSGVICVALALEPAEQASLGALEVIRDSSEKAEKPIVVWFYGSRREETARQFQESGRALAVPSLERGVRVLARMAQYESRRQTLAMR